MVSARLELDDQDNKEARSLGRILPWHEWSISCAANSKYRVSVLEALDLKKDWKSLTSPGTKDADNDDSLPNTSGDDDKCRSIVAINNFMACDVPVFASKEACREMSAPTEHLWKKIKRIGTYVVCREKVVGRGSLTAIG